MDSRPVERLAGVDVAHPDDQTAVHQKALDRRPPAPGEAGEEIAREPLAQRLDPQRGEMAILLQAPRGQRQDQPETARVPERQPAPVGEGEGDVLVRLDRRPSGFQG